MEPRKFKLTAADGTDMTEEIAGFASAIGLECYAPGRYSLLLTLGLFGGWKSGMQNPAKVMREIQALEGIGEASSLKPPIQNRHPPLKGLWHKHYLEDGLPSMALNLRAALKQYGIPLFKQRIADAEASGEERYVTAADVAAIADDVVRGNWERRMAAQALTGEWLIFAQHEGLNYYLCLATHDTSTYADVRVQIDAICCQEFPFLSELLA